MATMEEIQGALAADTLNLPENPPVVDIEVEIFASPFDDEGLRVTVTIRDDTDLDSVTGRDVSLLKEEIRERIRTLGEQRFAHVFFRTQTERMNELAGRR